MKRIVFAALLVVSSLALASGRASAQCDPTQPLCITPHSPGADQFAAALGTTPGELNQRLNAQLDGLFQVTNVNAFLRDFQNAQNFSSKGLGVDYASEATLAEVGGTFSYAFGLDKAYKPSGSSYTDPPISGGGANLSLMAGLGGGLFGLDPLMIFANWFKADASLGKLDGSYHNWGLHGQLRLFGPSRKTSALKMLIRWGGIAITSGVDYSNLSLSTSKQVRSTLNNVFPGAPVTVTSAGAVTFSLDQTTWSVPLEITTSLRLLFLTIYGGLGFDWQLGGGSNMNIDMTADLSGSYLGASYGDLGTATIKLRSHVSPSPARVREIVGLQLSIMGLVRIFAQVNVANSSPMLTSVAAGLRLAI